MAAILTRVFAAGLACLLPVPGTGAEAPEPDWQAINLAVTDTRVLPAYERFSRSTAALQPAAAALCQASDAASLATMQQAFHAAMDDWQSVSHIHFGPITWFNWNFRLQYWPDERGSGARALTALLAARDTNALQPDSFARQSVGVQGLPALESLLFEDHALTQLRDDAYRCAVVEAIAQNLATIAAEVLARWRDEFRTTVAGGAGQDYYASPRDASVDFYKALVENLRKYKEQKLNEVLGESVAALRPRRAESWRAQRSLRNLRLNLDALAGLYQGSEPALSLAMPQADRETIDAQFASLLEQTRALPDDFAGFADTPEGHGQLKAVSAAMDALYEALEAGLKNTELYLGFNSLDGD